MNRATLVGIARVVEELYRTSNEYPPKDWAVLENEQIEKQIYDMCGYVESRLNRLESEKAKGTEAKR